MIGILASFVCDLYRFFDAVGLYHFIQIHEFCRFIFVDFFGVLSALAELLQCNLSAQRRRCFRQLHSIVPGDVFGLCTLL